MGPLLPGETLACALGAGASPANRTTCSASFVQLSAPVACPTATGAPGFQLRCDGCAERQALAPQPGPVLCAGRTTLSAASGRFSDGAPPGGLYGPSSACSWLLAPGYAYVRLNFTRFATEGGFDYATVLAVHDDGGTEVLQKLSGSLLQVRVAPTGSCACMPRRTRPAAQSPARRRCRSAWWCQPRARWWCSRPTRPCRRRALRPPGTQGPSARPAPR